MNIKKKSPFVVAALLSTVCAATGGAALAGTSHSSAPQTSSTTTSRSHVHRLNGTWMTQVTLSDAPPGAPSSFSALDTFLPRGGLLVSSSAPNPAGRGLAHGTWTHQDHRSFTSSFTCFRFDPMGQYVGTQKVTRTMTLSRNQKRFRSQDVITILAPTGAVLATIHGTEVGRLLAG
jgi:hypothetical protein